MEKKVKTCTIPHEEFVEGYRCLVEAEAGFVRTQESGSKKQKEQAKNRLITAASQFHTVIGPATQRPKTFTGLKQHLDAHFPGEEDQNRKAVNHERLELRQMQRLTGKRPVPICVHTHTEDGRILHSSGVTLSVADLTSLLKGSSDRYARALTPTPLDRELAKESLLDQMALDILEGK